MVTTFHDENFNRRDKVEFESAFAELILGIANTQGARANPIFDAVCTVSRAIGADMVAAYGGHADARHSIHGAVRSDGGAWYGRAGGGDYTTEAGVGVWITEVLISHPENYGIQHHLHLHQLFTEYCALPHGTFRMAKDAIKVRRAVMKPPEMFAVRGRMTRSPDDAALAAALARDGKLAAALPGLKADVARRAEGFSARNWVGLQHPADRPAGGATTQTHGSGMQAWRVTGVDAAGEAKCPFIEIARNWLEMPLAGAASGSTADMLTSGLIIGGLTGHDARHYLIAIVAFLIGGGSHSFHEVASIGRLMGIPYTAGSYASLMTPRVLNANAQPFGRLAGTGLWKGYEITERRSVEPLNYGRVADVSKALGGKRPPSWAGLA